MIDASTGAFVMASHTMPDFLTPILYSLLAWTAAPLAVCACLGAGIGTMAFRWKQIGGAAFGLAAGMITVMPFTLLVVGLGMRFQLPGAITGGIVACIAGGCVAFLVARVGRPAFRRFPADNPSEI